MNRAAAIAKWTALGAAGMVAVFAVAMALGFTWLRSDGGRDWLARQIEDAASTPGEMELSIGEIAGELPQSLVAQNIVLSDREGSFLTIGMLEIDWKPWQLLHQTLAVQRIEFGAVNLARLPAAQPQAAEEAGGGGMRSLLDFPLKLRLARLAADEIAIGQPVLGQAARFTLAGEASRQDDRSLSARLELKRVDGISEHLAAAVRYQPQGDLLAAEAEAALAQGGLLAALLDNPDLPAAGLTLAGSGPLSDWAGDMALTAGNLARAQAALGLQQGDDGDLTFRVDGSGDIQPPEDGDLARLVAGTSAFLLHGAWLDGRRLQIDEFALRSDHLRLDLQGEIVPLQEALDLKLTASAEDAAAAAALAGFDTMESLAAELAVVGTFGLPQANVDLHAAGVSGPDFAAEGITLTGSVTAERDLLGPAPLLALDLASRIERPRLPGQDAVNQVLGAELPLSLAGRLHLGTSVLDLTRLEAAAGPMSLSAQGPLDLAEGSGELKTTVEITDLARLQPLTSAALGGPARFAGPVALERFGARIAADLAGRWEEPSSDIALIAAAAGRGLDLTARVAIDGGEVRLEQATARSAVTQLSASLTVADGALHDGRYTLRLSDAAALAGALAVDVAGPATLDGTVSGPFDALELGGRATVARLTIAEQDLRDLAAGYDLLVAGSDIDGPIELALASPYGNATARTLLQLRADTVTLADLRASLLQTTVSGRITVPLDGGDPSADLVGDIADLSPWLSIAGVSGSGTGRVAVGMNAPGAAMPFTASADFDSVTLQPAPGAAPVTVERLTLRAEGQDPDFSEPGRIDVAATVLRWDELALARSVLAARGTLSALDVTLDADGQWMEPLTLSLAAEVTQQAGTTVVELARADGSVFGQPLELRQPARLTLSPGETRVEGVDLASGEAHLKADATLGQEGLMLKATLDSLPLAAVDAFWNSGLAGTLSAEVDLAGNPADPAGTASLTASGLQPHDSPDFPPLQLAASADWQDGRLKAQGQLGGEAVAAARFSVDAPLRMTAGNAIELPPREPLSGRLDWSGDMKTLLLFVPQPQHRLDGTLEVALDLGGTPAAPNMEGRIALTGGFYENFETGTILRDLALAVQLSEERATLANLSATDGAGGTLSGSGDLVLDSGRDFPFDVAIDLGRFHAVRRDDVTAVTGGTVTLTGDLAAPLVKGRFTTETVEVSLLAHLPPTMVSLDVVEVKNGVVQQPPQDEAEAEPPIAVTLDVVVDMPNRVFVRGRGLDSEWSGRLSVQGESDSPRVSGTMTLVRGQLSVVGKPFQLKVGKVTLPEGADTEPALDVTAEHEGRDLTSTARLSGPLSAPELQLTSVPPVPRDEIVSRVLFNKTAAELTAAEAAQLAIALRELTGGGGADVLGFARRTLGVDVLRIESAEGDGTPAVEAGKYLSDRVYVGVKQGATSQSSSAGVEIELTPNITLESEVTGQGANKSGIRFQLDY